MTAEKNFGARAETPVLIGFLTGVGDDVQQLDNGFGTNARMAQTGKQSTDQFPWRFKPGQSGNPLGRGQRRRSDTNAIHDRIFLQRISKVFRLINRLTTSDLQTGASSLITRLGRCACDESPKRRLSPPRTNSTSKKVRRT
jgi:hypothetical protein